MVYRIFLANYETRFPVNCSNHNKYKYSVDVSLIYLYLLPDCIETTSDSINNK